MTKFSVSDGMTLFIDIMQEMEVEKPSASQQAITLLSTVSRRLLWLMGLLSFMAGVLIAIAIAR